MLAQTWNTGLIEKVGAMIGKEMERFNVTLRLAPGMNIHRNPLCGRNFEYYSEDPRLQEVWQQQLPKGFRVKQDAG